ncbi:oligopeptide:H+ symporter [Streptomyces tanashiensis]
MRSAEASRTSATHPRGLATLFMTEMWERSCYYGMRALLVLYLVSGGADAATGSQGGGLAMTAATATAIYSVYVSMVYLMAMPGGWFGDRVWGARKTVTIAGFVIMAGHASLAIPGQAMFFVGLALVAAGSGLLKANISTMVGHLYDGPDDPRRDGGFTLFYVGINLGAFVAPFGGRHRRREGQLAPRLRARRGRHGPGPGPVPHRHEEPQPEEQHRPERRSARPSARASWSRSRWCSSSPPPSTASSSASACTP